MNLCFGADPPAHPEHRPQVALWQAWSRTGRSGHAFDRSEAIPVARALAIQTKGGAWAGFEEADKGTIEPGKLADLAVWDTDLLRSKPEAAARAKVLMTMVGGKVVYRAQAG